MCNKEVSSHLVEFIATLVEQLFHRIYYILFYNIAYSVKTKVAYTKHTNGTVMAKSDRVPKRARVCLV